MIVGNNPQLEFPFPSLPQRNTETGHDNVEIFLRREIHSSGRQRPQSTSLRIC
jgi:hypothetical protein